MAKPVTMPMEPGAILTKDRSPSTTSQTDEMQRVPYAEAIGSILWPAMISRPDITFAVGILAQFIQNPAEVYWEALKRVISYLSSTKDLWLTFGGHDANRVCTFCDANWASQTHCHSISRYSFPFGDGAVSWSSKKQYIIALSSTEAEYIALTHAAKEALWLRAFLTEVQGLSYGHGQYQLRQPKRYRTIKGQ